MSSTAPTSPAGDPRDSSVHMLRGVNAGHDERPGDWIGPYRLLQVVGEGGFGVVWLAERREPFVQRVALKVIKPGMDSKAVVARFEQERQALAVMDHPNVAKVLDGGVTPSGRPYFVMEYVKGEAITVYCDRNRLTIRERLELFIPVCEAVQHAHMKGIIHRDIKPSNILVTVLDTGAIPDARSSVGDLKSASSTPEAPRAASISVRGGLVKVIDFGVAKAISHTLTDKTIFTEQGMIIGTPEYMSPEQAEMGATDIDTRTDVYSLGVVLYELLAGALPFDAASLRSKGYQEIQRIIREVDPPRPSTRLSSMGDPALEVSRKRRTVTVDLARELRRELEWVPLRAMRKDRAERYRAASNVADDIRRYLKGEPLEAGPESASYRLRKFMRRRRGVVTAVAAVILALAVGLAVAAAQALEAARQRDTANASEGRATVAAANAEKQRIRAQAAAADALAQKANAVAAQRLAEEEAYAANISAADASLRAGNRAGLRARLDKCPPAMRGWEWRYLDGRCEDCIQLLKGHSGIISTATFSPDGRTLLTASDDATARVWDLATGEARVFGNGSAAVRGAGLTHDGSQIVIASADGAVRLWDVATKKELASYSVAPTSIEHATLSPDGRYFAMGCKDGTIHLWDVVERREVWTTQAHSKDVQQAVISPDGEMIVSTGLDNVISARSLSTGSRIWQAEVGGMIPFVAFSRDSRRVAVVRNWGACVWDARQGTMICDIAGHTGSAHSLAFSHDGTRIATGGWDDLAFVWDLTTQKQVAKMIGHVSLVGDVQFSPDDAHLLTASWDGTARLWNAVNGSLLGLFSGTGGEVSSARFDPAGSTFVTTSRDGTVRLWDGAGVKDFGVLRGPIPVRGKPRISHDGQHILTWADNGTILVWDPGVRTDPLVLLGHEGRLTSSAFSPDDRRVLATSDDRTARLWDSRTGKLIGEFRGHDSYVWAGVFAADGASIVTGSADKTLRFWSVQTGAECRPAIPFETGVRVLAITDKGDRLALGLENQTVHILDFATGAEVQVLHGFTSWPTAIAFNADGTRVAAASAGGPVMVWTLGSTAPPVQLLGHTAAASGVAFDPKDSSRITTCGRDSTARVWNSENGRELLVVPSGAGEFEGVQFSPSGVRIILTESLGSIRILNSATYAQQRRFFIELTAAAPAAKELLDKALNASPDPESAADAISASDAPAAVRRVALSALASRMNAPAAEKDKAAHALVDRLSAEDLTREEIIERVKTEPMDAATRARALQLAEAIQDTGHRFNSIAWNTAVRESGLTDAQRNRAVEIAERSVAALKEEDNERRDAINTLGVCQYRAGRYAAALQTLRRSEALHVAKGPGRLIGDLAFIAMCEHRLGHADEAIATLRAARELPVRRPETEAETTQFLREATKLIVGTVEGK